MNSRSGLAPVTVSQLSGYSQSYSQGKSLQIPLLSLSTVRQKSVDIRRLNQRCSVIRHVRNHFMGFPSPRGPDRGVKRGKRFEGSLKWEGWMCVYFLMFCTSCLCIDIGLNRAGCFRVLFKGKEEIKNERFWLILEGVFYVSDFISRVFVHLKSTCEYIWQSVHCLFWFWHFIQQSETNSLLAPHHSGKGQSSSVSYVHSYKHSTTAVLKAIFIAVWNS